MIQPLAACALLVATVSAIGDLDIPALLGSLGPAPEGDSRFTSWSPPGPDDVRSPCPGLNTLANHGFINHSGKDLTIPELITGLAAGMNIGPDFSIGIGAAGLLSSPDPLAGSFDLDDLDQHNFPIEHDASLSRQDAYFGNDYSFYDKYWQQVASFYSGDHTAILPAALSLANRTNDSKEINPTFTYGLREFLLRYGETALYLQAMGGDATNGVTRVDWIRMMFEQERLPYSLGWRPRADPVTFMTLGSMILTLFNANPQEVPEGGIILQDSYKNVFEVIVGGSEVLANLTQGLSTAVGL